MSKKSTSGNSRPATSWSARYGARHRLHRIREFPGGIQTPRRVRIYRRAQHFVLQWWDLSAGTNLCERVDGDLIDAVAAARRIEQRLEDFRSSGQPRRRLGHRELVEEFLRDLGRRADAGEVAPATVARYRSALSHYVAFTEMASVARAYSKVTLVDRTFALDFAAFLNDRRVTPNGHAHAEKRKLRGLGFILDTTRAMFEWASDPARGNALPAGFRNPFRRATLKQRRPVRDPLTQPNISAEVAAEFLAACRRYQLSLFAPLLICGLRAAEPALLFREHIQDGQLRIGCVPELAYATKGGRDKRLPLLGEIAALWRTDLSEPGQGLVLVRRSVTEGREIPPLLGQSLLQLAREYDRRCAAASAASAVSRRQIRDAVLRDAGGLNYDLINGEFRRVARNLNWPPTATLKDFRHLFATMLVNAGMPEPFRRYLLGHSPGRDAIVTYTHLDGLKGHFVRAIHSQWESIVQVLRSALRTTPEETT